MMVFKKVLILCLRREIIGKIALFLCFKWRKMERELIYSLIFLPLSSCVLFLSNKSRASGPFMKTLWENWLNLIEKLGQSF